MLPEKSPKIYAIDVRMRKKYLFLLWRYIYIYNKKEDFTKCQQPKEIGDAARW